MSADLTLDVENQQHYPMMDSETGIISIDQGGEWGKRRSYFLETHINHGASSYLTLLRTT